jgi:hypothetical protein
MNPSRLHTTELPTTGWYKSSYSDGGEQCVEVAALPGGLAVRDSKDTTIPAFRATATAWTTFLHALHTDRI